MYGFMLAFLGLALAADPIELPKDVAEIQTRDFAMPLRFNANVLAKIEKVRLFVSEDRGKTWKHEKDYKRTDERVTYTAERDGQYWFALQVEFTDGTSDPAKVEALTPAMKVYVNTARKVLKGQKSYEELLREVEELRATVEQLQKKVKELEADRKPR
jgi:hypothetical protein